MEKFETITCDIVPKYCWYYNKKGEMVCDYIYHIEPFAITNIKKLLIYKEKDKIKNIKIPNNNYHPNFNSDGIICNSIFSKKIIKIDLTIDEIIKTITNYYFTSCFKILKMINITLFRYDIINGNINMKIFPLKIIGSRSHK